MSVSVRQYTDKQLLDRVASLKSFKSFPKNYWLIGVRSNLDKFNIFDDKFFLFKGETFIEAYIGTTNAGNDLLNPTNPRGEAVLKSDEIYYDCWSRGKHRGKVEAYVQTSDLLIFRDNDRDKKIEQLGTPRLERVGINIHPATYNSTSEEVKSLINGWSQGCQVFAKRNGQNSFNSFMRKTEGQSRLTYCLLQEFDPNTTIKKLVINKLADLPEPIKNEKFLSDDEVSSILSEIKESSEKTKDFKNENNSITSNDLIIGTKETPSTTTIITSGSLQTSGVSSLITAIYTAITNPNNLALIIICLIIGIFLVSLGIYNYRKSSAEKLEINKQKLDSLSDRNKFNADLK